MCAKCLTVIFYGLFYIIAVCEMGWNSLYLRVSREQSSPNISMSSLNAICLGPWKKVIICFNFLSLHSACLDSVHNSSDSELRFWTAQVTLCAAAKTSHGRPDPTLSAFTMINSFYRTCTETPFHSSHHLPSKVTGTIPGLHPFSFQVSGPWGSPCWPLTTQLFFFF